VSPVLEPVHYRAAYTSKEGGEREEQSGIGWSTCIGVLTAESEVKPQMSLK